MAHQHDEPGVPNQAAVFINSQLWRSVHLAAPPLSGATLSPQQLAALAPAAGGNVDAQFQNYLSFANDVSRACVEATEALREDRQISAVDRTWLRTRLEALSRRIQASVPPHGPANPAQADAVRVAVERIGPTLRHDVEVYPTRPNFSRSIHEFIILTLEGLHGQLVHRNLDEAFLWTDVVGILYIDIDMRAWYRFCRNVTWNSLYYDDIAHHLDDMRDDLRRIQSRRQAFQRQLSLAKSEFVPVGRRSGMAF